MPTATMPSGGVSVHVLPYADAADEGLLAGDGRGVEAAMVARYIRWLLALAAPGARSRTRMRSGRSSPATSPCWPASPPTCGCCCASSTRSASSTARAAARLFLGHPVVRQYLLALRALADRDDGVAEAALLRPPFFAIDCADAVAGVVNKND